MRASHFALALISLAAAWSLQPGGPAAAQPAPPPTQEAAPKEIALTQKQIDDMLAAHKDIAAIESKIPESDQAPNPKVIAQLDAAAKKHGFADYGQYQEVEATVSMVISGFDFETKKFIGSVAVLKKQIAELQADKSMPAADKKQALAELNESLQAAPSVKPMPANIDLVGKNFDKLSEVFQQDE